LFRNSDCSKVRFFGTFKDITTKMSPQKSLLNSGTPFPPSLNILPGSVPGGTANLNSPPVSIFGILISVPRQASGKEISFSQINRAQHVVIVFAAAQQNRA
jgi:hypothetical protein